MAPSLEITMKDIPGQDKVKLVQISGDLDRGSVKEGREQLLSYIEKGNVKLIVDLSGLNFCDKKG